MIYSLNFFIWSYRVFKIDFLVKKLFMYLRKENRFLNIIINEV